MEKLIKSRRGTSKTRPAAVWILTDVFFVISSSINDASISVRICSGLTRELRFREVTLEREAAYLPIRRVGSTRPQRRTIRHRLPARRYHAPRPASVPDNARCSTDPLRSKRPLSRNGQKFCSCFGSFDCTFEISLLIMFSIVSRRSRERDPHAARMQKVAMRPFASAIHKPMFFQIRNELSNLPRHIKLAAKKQLQSNAKLPKFVAAIHALASERISREVSTNSVSSLVLCA